MRQQQGQFEPPSAIFGLSLLGGLTMLTFSIDWLIGLVI
jgi:hypothetical protein